MRLFILLMVLVVLGAMDCGTKDPSEKGTGPRTDIDYCGELPEEPVDCNDVLDSNDNLITVPNPRAGVCCQRENNANSQTPTFRFAQLELTEPGALSAAKTSLRQFIGFYESFNWLFRVDLENEMILTGYGKRNSFAQNERVTYSFADDDAPAEDGDPSRWNPIEIPIIVEETERGVEVTSNPTIANLRIPVFASFDAERPNLELPLYQIEIVRALITEDLNCIGHAKENPAFNTIYCGQKDDPSNGILEGYLLVKDTLESEVDLGGNEPVNLCSVFNGLNPCDCDLVDDDTACTPGEAEMNRWLATGVCTDTECHERGEDEDCTLEGPYFCAYGVSAVFAAHAVSIENAPEIVDPGTGGDVMGAGGMGGSGNDEASAGGTGGELEAAGGSGGELEAAGGTGGELEAAGGTGGELEAAGGTGGELEAAGGTGGELEAVGGTGGELNAAGGTGGELEAAGGTGGELEAAGGMGGDGMGAGGIGGDLNAAGGMGGSAGNA